jgi:hypothetical protein
MCGTWTTASARRWLSKTWPQRQVILELGFCDGIRSPACHTAYFRSVQSLSAPTLKIRFRPLGQKHSPCHFEVGAGLVKGSAVPLVHSAGCPTYGRRVKHRRGWPLTRDG